MGCSKEYKSILDFPTTSSEYNKEKYYGISNGWFRKTEDPIYIFKKVDEALYEVLSLFFAENNVVLEHHKIGKLHLEKSTDYNYLNNINTDSLVDALNDGLGDRLWIGNFNKTECDKINNFMHGLGILASLYEEDFEDM